MEVNRSKQINCILIDHVAMYDKHVHKKLYSNLLAIQKINHNTKAVLQWIEIIERYT